MRTYDDWKNDILTHLNALGINYGYFGDWITCIDDHGHTISGAYLKCLWEDKCFVSEVINILTNKA